MSEQREALAEKEWFEGSDGHGYVYQYIGPIHYLCECGDHFLNRERWLAHKIEKAEQRGAGRVAAALLSARVVCPVHGIPDCGPLLNGCQIPRYIAEWRGEFLAALTTGAADRVRAEEGER